MAEFYENDLDPTQPSYKFADPNPNLDQNGQKVSNPSGSGIGRSVYGFIDLADAAQWPTVYTLHEQLHLTTIQDTAEGL
jgi:hypothetical protein